MAKNKRNFMNTNIKKFSLSILLSLLIVGCGSSGGGNDTSTSHTPPASTPVEIYDFSVERGPVISALVVDANGNSAYNISNGIYRFTTKPTYPIYVSDGYIDVNRDSIINTNDTKLPMALSITDENISSVTVVTTLISDGDIKNYLMTTFNLSQNDLYLKPSESLKISAISDIVFKYMVNNNISSISQISLVNLQTLQAEIENLILQNQASTKTILETVTQNEIDLVNELAITLSSDEVTTATQIIAQRSATTNSITTLTQQQIDDLIFMYQEEKVARDVYTELYELWGQSVFKNIIQSENSHMNGVKSLLLAYNIPLPIVDTNIGEFPLAELQEMYNTLMAKGRLSANDALEVGVIVEEKDIEDLIAKMENVPADILKVYGNLLNGSYNHLDAFNKNLNK